MLISIAGAFVLVAPIVLPPSSGELMEWKPFGTFAVTSGWKLMRDAGWSPGIRSTVAILGHAPILLVGSVAFLATASTVRGVYYWFGLMAVAGACAALLFVAGGNSQLYFWYYGYVAAAFLAAVGLIRLLQTPRSWRRSAASGTVGVLLLIGLASILFQSRPGVRQLTGTYFRLIQRNPDNQVPEPKAQISREVANGLVWVSMHTPTRAVLAVNTPAPPFYYSALTERDVFLEDSIYTVEFFEHVAKVEREQIVAQLFTGDMTRVCEAASESGVSYLIDVKTGSMRSHTAAYPSPPLFENGAIRVLSVAGCHVASSDLRYEDGSRTVQATSARFIGIANSVLRGMSPRLSLPRRRPRNSSHHP
jgi:hypothetical protein